MKIIAVTCARMASARFPGKCLAMLDGKPLIQHTIDFARAIGIQLYTFTRDQEIIEYVKDKTPVIYEPIELYDTPQNTTYEKMQYVNRILDADYVILLQPTCPVRIEEIITSWIRRFTEKLEYSAGFTGNPEPDGAFYIWTKYDLIEKKYHELVMGNQPVFDINTPEDLKRCEEWLQGRK